MEIKTKLIANTNLRGYKYETLYGYGCGYVGVPEGHPWHGMEYDDLRDVDVHGGLTWSENYIRGDEEAGWWWVGFDTSHVGDDPINCDEDYCNEQIEKLKQQALRAIV